MKGSRNFKKPKMEIISHTINGAKIAEVISDNLVINNNQDGLELLINLYYQDFDGIILHEKNITSTFFDLKSGIAGEILQKFSTYSVRLSIIGDFSKFNSDSLHDFIYESNKGRHISFVSSVSDAISKLSD
jgi:hypothetical protein